MFPAIFFSDLALFLITLEAFLPGWNDHLAWQERQLLWPSSENDWHTRRLVLSIGVEGCTFVLYWKLAYIVFFDIWNKIHSKMAIDTGRSCNSSIESYLVLFTNKGITHCSLNACAPILLPLFYLNGFHLAGHVRSLRHLICIYNYYGKVALRMSIRKYPILPKMLNFS